jgi:hypothetical protein
LTFLPAAEDASDAALAGAFAALAAASGCGLQACCW